MTSSTIVPTSESAVAILRRPFRLVRTWVVALAAALVCAGGAVAASPPAALTVAEHGDHQVVQRTIGTTSGVVPFSGTFSGPSPDHLDARVVAITSAAVAVDWTTIAHAPAGGTWSAGLTVPQGGWYRVEVRSVAAGGAVLASAASTVPWGVGIDILCIGQSNMAGFGDTDFTMADDRVGQVRGGTAWQHLADPWITGLKASCGPALGNALVSALDIPIGLVPAATLDTTMVGTRNTDLSFRNPADHADPATTYGKALRAVATAGAVEFVCVSQGAAEAFLDTVGTSDYVAAFHLMEENFRADLPHGDQVRFVLSQLGRRIATPVANAGYDAIREAHRLLDDGVTTLLAGSTVDFPLADGITHYGQAGQDPHGRRFARAILYALGRRASYGGPRIAGAAFRDAGRSVVLVTIAHRGGGDFQPTTAIPGFAVRDAAGPKVVGAARVSGAVIALTCTTPCSGATTITYLQGMDPAGPLGLFRDDQADPEPLLPITVPLTVQAPPVLPATVTLGGLGATYDGAAHAATVTTTPTGLATTLTYAGGTTLPVAAGSYAVTATVTDPDYTGGASGTLVIAPAAATVALSGLNATFDGGPHAATVTTTPPGLAFSITYDGGATVPVAIGDHAVAVTVTDPNHTGGATGTLTVAAPVTPPGGGSTPPTASGGGGGSGCGLGSGAAAALVGLLALLLRARPYGPSASRRSKS